MLSFIYVQSKCKSSFCLITRHSLILRKIFLQSIQKTCTNKNQMYILIIIYWDTVKRNSHSFVGLVVAEIHLVA